MQNTQKLFSLKFFVPLCIVLFWSTAMFTSTSYKPFAGITGQAATNKAVLLYPSQPEDAYSLALFALDLDPNIYEANVTAGFVLYDQNDFSGGIPYFEKSALIKSNNCQIQFGLGYGYEVTGEANKAIKQYQIGEQKCPQDIDILNSFLEAYLRLGYEEGVNRIRQKLSQITLSSPLPTVIATTSDPAIITPISTQKVVQSFSPSPLPTKNPPPISTQSNNSPITIYNMFDDFSQASNPSPSTSWAYGYTMSLGGTFDVYRKLSHEINQEKVIVWTRPENFLTPNISVNTSGKDVINADGCILHPSAEYVILHPGENKEYSVVRWTAQLNGTYLIDIAFKSVRFCSDSTSTDAHVLYNSTPIFNVAINEFSSGGEHVFSKTIYLNIGDTIDFVVGVGDNGNYYADSTGLKATIKLLSSK